MMNKILLAAIISVSTVGIANAQEKQPMKVAVEAPAPAPVKSPKVTNQLEWGSVTYSSPSKNGRVIFGDLVPYGKVWRTGANMSTDITFTKDVKIAGKKVKAGTYSLFTIPEKDEWTVILNSVPEQRGTSKYEENKKNNVLETKIKVSKQSPVMEAFTISGTKKAINIMWDDVLIAIPVK